MKKLVFHMMEVLGAALLAGALVSCEPATENKPIPVAAPSSKAYALTQTPGTDWPKLKVGVNPLADKTISKATYTYAVDANMLLSATGFGYNLEYNSQWTPDQSAPSKPNTWTKTAELATFAWNGGSATFTPVVDKGVNINTWSTGTNPITLYVKQIDLTYTDATTEVITFTTTAATPVRIVASSGTTDVAFATRLWVSDWADAVDKSAGLTQGVVTVAF